MATVLRTQEQEAVGVGATIAIGTDTLLPMPTGLGGVRMLLGTGSGPASCVLPDARKLRPGGEAQYVLAVDAAGTATVTVKDNTGSTVATIAENTASELILLRNDTAAGVWLQRNTPTIGGPFESNTLRAVEIEIRQTVVDFSMRAALLEGTDWDGKEAILAICTIRNGAVVGASRTTAPAMMIEFLSTGSLVRLNLESGSYINGKGGGGGRGGGGGLLSQNGAPGGPALYIYNNTNLVSHGFIQGGGGGGGGGAAISGVAGGGGGGGAGYEPSLGGPAGGSGARAGGGGGLNTPGFGGIGANTGAYGGGPGAAGQNPISGGAGGAAGAAIGTWVGAALNKIRPGVILGAEVPL